MTDEADDRITMATIVKVTRDADYRQWLTWGQHQGYISEQFCSMHDMAPMPAGEALAFDMGDDPCQPAVRLWGPSGPPEDFQQPDAPRAGSNQQKADEQ